MTSTFLAWVGIGIPIQISFGAIIGHLSTGVNPTILHFMIDLDFTCKSKTLCAERGLRAKPVEIPI